MSETKSPAGPRRSTVADAIPRHPVAQAARDRAASEGKGKLEQKKAARAALREAGLPVNRAGREAAAAQAASKRAGK